jgi:6,7-dimethyl-8-ribityllumazine synthase
MNQHSTHAATRIAIIQSSWHKEIVDQGRESFIKHLIGNGAANGITRDIIDVFEVPGAFEIPLHAKILARSCLYRGIVACGLVVDGGIYRHDFVAASVINGLMQVQLETEVPVFSMVLTPHHFHEHAEHRDFFLHHFLTKGREAAQACLRTLQSIQDLPIATPQLMQAS